MGGRPSGGSRRWWIAYSALGLAAIAAFFAFPLSTGVRSAIEVAFPLSNVVAIVVGVRMFRPERTGPWMLFAVGMAFFTAYTLARAVARIGVGPSDPQTLLEQIFQAIGYVLVIAALVSLIYSRRGGESDRTTLIDASILVIGAAIPFWVFVLAPLAHNASFSLGARLSPMSSAVADLVLLAVSVRLALSRGARTTAFSLLIAAMVSSLVANTMVVPALSGGSALTQTSPFNIFFLAAYLFAGAAPLHPSMKALTDVGHHESRLTAARIVMFSLASLTGWMSYLVQVVRALPVDFTVVLMGTVVIFFLVLLRLVGIADALERREQSARLLFESSPLPMWVYDANDMRFLAVNDAAVHHYGYQRDEFLTMTLREIRPEEDVRALEEHMETVNPWTMNHGLWRHRKRDGSVIDVEVASHGVTFDEHQARLAVVVDVTDRKRMSAEKETLERQLWQAQKLEAVGQLAGGIAHDFNNLLAVMLNYISFVKAELDPSSSEYEDLGEAMSAGERAAQLVEHLLTFSRRELVSPEVLDVNVVVRDMEKILRRSVKESVDLKITAGDDLWRSKIDRGRLEQVLVNLVVNADAAMPDGGVLEISTRNNAIDEVAASHRAELEAGDYVRLSVSDTGLGMPAEVASHIFEPFFTTKPVGEGTGLGLATVYGVVKKAGGYIYVYSEEGCGSTFNIYLPATTSPADLRIEESVAEPAGGTETVLVVEDEAGVRDIAVRILTEAGYQVMSAGDPLDALEMVRTDGSHIDLVLTDVIMPNLSGKALVERLRNKRAGLRVLYMSGYTDEVIANQGVLDPGVRLLQKPFDARALLSAVREALNDDLAVVDVPQKRRVLVVDDEAPMRQVLRLFLETNGFLVVGEAEDAPSAIEMARTLDPDLIVLDHLLHGMTGGDAAPMLRVCAPDTRILAFSAALDAKPEWADGWLTKERIAEMVPALEELVPA